MSKIQAELSKATDLTLKRGVDRQDFLFDLVKAVAALSDADWEALSKAAQDWYNAAADAKNAKKSTLPDFPDLEDEKKKDEDEAPRRRRASADDADKEPEGTVKVGDTIKGVSTRGKTVEGKVTEIEGDLLIVDDGGADLIEFNYKTAKSLDIVGGEKKRRKAEDDEPPVDDGPFEPKKGDEVTVTNKRGKTVTGKIVEIDDDQVVVDDGKEEHEFQKDRIESIVPVGGKKAAEPASTRRAAKKDEEPAAEGKRTRSSNSEGVSVSQRINELIVEDLDISEAAICKALTKEGIAFKENTVTLNYKAAHKLLDLLKAKKLIKS